MTTFSMAARQRLQTLKRFALGAFALLCVMGGLQMHMAGPHAQTADTAERLRAVQQASGLLLSPASIEPTSPAENRFQLGIDAPRSASATNPNASTPMEPDGQMPPVPRASPISPMSQIPPLPPMPALTRKPTSPGLPVSAALPNLPTVSSSPAVPPTPDPPNKAMRIRKLPEPIPEAIESGLPPSRGQDPLATALILPSLRVIDGSQTPLQLLATQIDGRVPRAQMGVRMATGKMLSVGGWLEPGEGPLPGWQLLSVSAGEVLLLTPQGNPLRLRLRAGSGG